MKIVKNKYLNALFLLMLLSAIIHVLILFYMFSKSGNIYILNFFNIVDLSYFLPSSVNSFFGNIVSFIFVIVLYGIILKINKN